ncbi:DUF5908 family protein [Myxococcus stipitatus]|uniref:DUF5908 family protein n=1 Tax=Myxococcus stipitatus TaxID=83455 RepID=UPI001F38898C|nr:DUF5908 family protein [Myxococcus stipitatus]MCE9672069.1 DUF5908 family protein [Myxococcus stipitatus]
MPLEVNEIGIQLRVRDGADASSSDKPSTPVGDCGCSDEKKERQAMVEECLRRVLQVLRARQER